MGSGLEDNVDKMAETISGQAEWAIGNKIHSGCAERHGL